MKANVKYNDLEGTVAADISDLLGVDNDIENIGKYFNLDKSKYEIIGLSITGIQNFDIFMICIDKEKKEQDKGHIVKIRCKVQDQDIYSLLFKRLNIVLLDKHVEDKYKDVEYSEVTTVN